MQFSRKGGRFFVAESAPWLAFYGDIPRNLDYFDGTMWQGIQLAAEKYPQKIAFDFMGKSTSYKTFAEQVKTAASSLLALGVQPGDHVTICLPNCPQGVVMFYAVNAVGAISDMVHPLSGEKEIEFYLKESSARFAVTLDQFYGKFAAVWSNTSLEKLIVTSVSHALSPLKSVGYALTEGRKVAKVPYGKNTLSWKNFLSGASSERPLPPPGNARDGAVLLYSGGTTGTTKGVLLSNGNFNALAQQVIAANPMFRPGDKMLAVMPIFHGFGLGVSVHSMLFHGGHCLLVPRFTVKSYAKLLKKEKCNFIAGVPSLYEALLREESMKNADLSSLKGVFSGGDSLSVGLKKRLDAFLTEHGASVSVREGYGTTECVTASCLTPVGFAKEGSIGIPFPDTFYKIVRPQTEEEVPYGNEGEICLSGPTVMLGYLNRPEENAQTLRRHADGKTWVHTGDLGMMDGDGFVYFRQRLKRVIVTNGYNIYPSQIENVLDSLPQVLISCVIGVDDPLRGQAVKAFLVLKEGVPQTEETKKKIREEAAKHIAGYALPRQMEFRTELPKTTVGKVAYRILEEEEKQKLT